MRSMRPDDITERSQAALEQYADLAWLATDPALPVRLQVARRRHLPEPVATTLARDPAVEVRATVLLNNPHRSVVVELTTDPHPGVAKEAVRRYQQAYLSDPMRRRRNVT